MPVADLNAGIQSRLALLQARMSLFTLPRRVYDGWMYGLFWMTISQGCLSNEGTDILTLLLSFNFALFSSSSTFYLLLSLSAPRSSTLLFFFKSGEGENTLMRLYTSTKPTFLIFYVVSTFLMFFSPLGV
jgi:hypothetical protein